MKRQIPETEATQATKEHVVRYVLAVSLALAVVALIGVGSFYG